MVVRSSSEAARAARAATAVKIKCVAERGRCPGPVTKKVRRPFCSRCQPILYAGRYRGGTGEPD